MAFLPKMGFNRHTAHAVIYWPEERGGLGIKNLYIEQSVEQIKALTQHIQLASPLGKIMRININWVQLIAGTTWPIFEDTKRLLHLEGEWFISIREFLHSINATIKIDGVWTPQLERKYERCLMVDIFANDITTTELVRINRCRIYLQATMIADIMDAEGTEINDYAWGLTTTTKQQPINP